MHERILPIATTPTERRIRREARSATLRERALALRRVGWTYAAIGQVLGVSLERARRITLQAERLANAPRWYDGLPARAVNLLHQRGLSALSEIDAAGAGRPPPRRAPVRPPEFRENAFAAPVAPA